MTPEQKKAVTRLRADGAGYARISQELGISINTIKTFCRRNALTGVAGEPSADSKENRCPQCGTMIEQISGRKEKKFCSDSCRNLWWNAHLDRVERRAYYSFSCPICGRSFESYGNSRRKYCSRSCANTARRKSNGR